MGPSIDMHLQTITAPPSNMVNNVTGSITFSTASTDLFTSVIGAQGEPALIFKKHGALVADLLFKFQLGSSVPASEHTAH